MFNLYYTIYIILYYIILYYIILYYIILYYIILYYIILYYIILYYIILYYIILYYIILYYIILYYIIYMLVNIMFQNFERWNSACQSFNLTTLLSHIRVSKNFHTFFTPIFWFFFEIVLLISLHTRKIQMGGRYHSICHWMQYLGSRTPQPGNFVFITFFDVISKITWKFPIFWMFFEIILLNSLHTRKIQMGVGTIRFVIECST